MSTIKSSTTITTAYSVEADTTGALVIQTGATPTTAVTVGTDQSVTLAGALAVNGNTTLGDASTDTILMTGAPSIGGAGLGMGMGFRNRIINGSMQIAQRATSATITAGSTIALGYSTVDRFYVYCTGANVTAAQVAGTGATKNRLRITGAASVTAVGIGQRIEQLNSYDLAGSTATLSADLAISATLTTVTWTASYATTTADTFGTLASPTVTQIATGTFTVTSTVTNFSTNISIPAAATTGIQIVFTVGALTAGLTWTVGNVQLEKGSTATSFDYRPYLTELQLCQRYYVGVNTYWFTVGYDVNYATENKGGLSWSYQMRLIPSMSITAGGMTGHHGIPPAAASISYYGVYLYFGGAAYRPNVSTSASVDFNLTAEL